MLVDHGLEMSKNRIVMRSTTAPMLEIDPASRAVYIRFSRAKVHKTIADKNPGAGVIITTDIDARNNLIGVEILGVKEFSLKVIRRVLPEALQNIDLESARFMPAASCLGETVPA
jgi:Protein of unknown function (DUF2283)